MSSSPGCGTEPSPWTGAVLIGGASRRMGRDKASLRRPSGETWLDHTLSVLAAAGASQRLVVEACADPGTPPRPERLALPEGVQRAFDRSPALGPLAGVEAALAAADHPWCLIVACDHPRLDPDCLRELAALASAEREGSDTLAVIPRVEGRLQPLHACYARAALPQVRAAIAAGELALKRLPERLPTRVVDVRSSATYLNANTPEEAAAVWRSSSQTPQTPQGSDPAGPPAS